MQIFVRRSGAAPVAFNVQPTLAAGELMEILVPNARHADQFYLSHGGKLLSDASTTLADYGIGDLGAVELGIRARGGGGDGGATGAESRDCYLNMYAEKKPDKVDPNEAKLAKCTRCAYSAESLRPPCVADQLGNVYNKDAVLSGLLAKSKKLSGLRWRDLVDIKFSSIPGIDADDEHVETKYRCPVTLQELTGKFKFVALKGCGHVLSARAFEKIRTTECPVCDAQFKEEDKLPLNGTEEEVALLREKIKAKKKPKNGVTAAAAEKKANAGGVKREAAQISASSSAVVAVAAVKKAKPLPVPAHAKSDVYKSIFTSSGKANDIRETYSCRALPIGRN